MFLKGKVWLLLFASATATAAAAAAALAPPHPQTPLSLFPHPLRRRGAPPSFFSFYLSSSTEKPNTANACEASTVTLPNTLRGGNKSPLLSVVLLLLGSTTYHFYQLPVVGLLVGLLGPSRY